LPTTVSATDVSAYLKTKLAQVAQSIIVELRDCPAAVVEFGPPGPPGSPRPGLFWPLKAP
jgi:hypothetical protein